MSHEKISCSRIYGDYILRPMDIDYSRLKAQCNEKKFSRDFCMNCLLPGPWISLMQHFNFSLKCFRRYSQLKVTPMVNGKMFEKVFHILLRHYWVTIYTYSFSFY